MRSDEAQNDPTVAPSRGQTGLLRESERRFRSYFVASPVECSRGRRPRPNLATKRKLRKGSNELPQARIDVNMLCRSSQADHVENPASCGARWSGTAGWR